MSNSATYKTEIIPQPQSVKISGTSLDPAKMKHIRVSDSPENRFAARILRQAIREIHGIDCEIELAKFAENGSPQLFLSEDISFISHLTIWPVNRKEGYFLEISDKGAAIFGNDGAGLFYGVQTLIQLFEQAQREKSAIPGMEISDWPQFGLRGTYIDTDQFKGSIRVTQRNMEDMIRQMSRFKLNFMVLEMYNLMPFKSFPYCADEDTLTLSSWRYLVELANSYHIVIMPSLQSFAQMYDILWPCEEGKPYREWESFQWPGIICPSRPEGIEFLKGLYRDLLEVFKYTPYLGVGCSEVGMSWKEFCPLCQRRLDSGESFNDIYEKHVSNCTEAVRSVAKEMNRNVRPWMWADEFYSALKHRGYKNFEGMELIGKDVVMCHWSYWSKVWSDTSIGDYLGIKGLLERGYDISFASASYLYNSYLLDLSPDEPSETTTEYSDTTKKFYLTKDSGVLNITDQAKFANEYQRRISGNNLLGGICCTFSQHDIKCWDTTWYAYALHADYTWGDPSRPWKDYKKTFTSKFAPLFYGARDNKASRVIADAYLDLDAAKNDIEQNNYIIRDIIGEYDIQDSAYIDNTLENSLAMIRELMENPGGPGRTIADIRKRAENIVRTARRVRNELAALAHAIRNTYSWSYLITAAKKMENHAARTIYMLDQELTIRSFTAGKDMDALDKLADRLAVLRSETHIIIDEANELSWGRGISATPWNPTADTTGTTMVLKSLDGFASALSDFRTKKK